jgi:hypothetical protein
MDEKKYYIVTELPGVDFHRERILREQKEQKEILATREYERVDIPRRRKGRKEMTPQERGVLIQQIYEAHVRRRIKLNDSKKEKDQHRKREIELEIQKMDHETDNLRGRLSPSSIYILDQTLDHYSK